MTLFDILTFFNNEKEHTSKNYCVVIGGNSTPLITIERLNMMLAKGEIASPLTRNDYTVVPKPLKDKPRSTKYLQMDIDDLRRVWEHYEIKKPFADFAETFHFHRFDVHDFIQHRADFKP